MTLLQYIIFIKILLISSSQDIQINTSFKCNSSNSEGLKIGDKVTLCIHFKELNKKIPFIIEVDKYSAVSIAGGFTLAHNFINNPSENKTLNLISQIGNFTTKYPAVKFIIFNVFTIFSFLLIKKNLFLYLI